MATAHQCSVQRRRRAGRGWFVVAFGWLAASCETPVPPSIWPPPDFALAVEQVRHDPVGVQVAKRFRVRADGLVVYGTATTSVVGGDPDLRLPVFDRLAVYQLEPQCTRALARRIERCGVLDLDPVQGERGAVAGPSIVLAWQALGQRKSLSASGAVHGAMAEILAIVEAHLPEGERLDLPGVADRNQPRILRGVPVPREDAGGALEMHRALLQKAPADGEIALDAFVLACHLGHRQLAETLLEQWAAATAEPRRAQSPFADAGGAGGALSPEALATLLPGSPRPEVGPRGAPR